MNHNLFQHYLIDRYVGFFQSYAVTHYEKNQHKILQIIIFLLLQLEIFLSTLLELKHTFKIFLISSHSLICSFGYIICSPKHISWNQETKCALYPRFNKMT